MTLYLIRHATAGQRGAGPADDLDRALDEGGAIQASAISDLLANRGIDRVLSSPALRCIQTVEPLAAGLALELEVEPCLIEGSDADSAVALMRQCAGNNIAALCTHGDVIADSIQALAREGMGIVGTRAWAKGSTWQLDVRGTDIVSAKFLGPY